MSTENMHFIDSIKSYIAHLTSSAFVVNGIFSLDILPVLGHKKRGVYISPHLHLSVAFLIEADENDVIYVAEKVFI